MLSFYDGTYSNNNALSKKTADHRPNEGNGDLVGDRHVAGTGQGSSGFSTDVEKAAQGLKNMFEKK